MDAGFAGHEREMSEMTVLPRTSEQNRPDTVSAAQQEELERLATPPVLVTEQQVRLSTAAAGSLPSTETAPGLTDAFRRVVSALHGVFVAPAAQQRPHRGSVPPRSRSYYESSLVSRERMRL